MGHAGVVKTVSELHWDVQGQSPRQKSSSKQHINLLFYKLADKIKELVAGWVRTKKRAADVSVGGDEKRPRLAEPKDGGGQKARAKKGGKPKAPGGRKSGP